MATTVNGWQVIESNDTTGPLPRLRKFVLPDVKGQDNTPRHFYLRDGSCGLVLMHVLLFFHEKVERLDVGIWDDWGWAVRPVRGQTSGYSNHAGAVAADANATRHPLGVAIDRTFTASQVRRIRWRLKLYRGLVIWGGNWSRPDGMHFELAPANLSRVESLARFLMRTPRGKRILDANPGLKRVIQS
jgi:hypothetical protein